MRRRRFEKPHFNHEFELDLAPLLAVMVKLVPVLLISSAFVSIMMIETDLPQAVKEVIEQNKQDDKPQAQIYVDVSNKTGLRVRVELGNKKLVVDEIPLLANGDFDYKTLHKKLQGVKAQNPQIFKLEIMPEDTVSYDSLVKVMDEARKSRDANVRFPVFDKQTGKEITTDFMFPDVVFGNVLEG